MKIEKAVKAIEFVSGAHVDFRKSTIKITTVEAVDVDEINEVVSGLGSYSLNIIEEVDEPAIYSILVWGIVGAILIFTVFYLLQTLGMQSWTMPIEFMTDKWYLVAPLVLGFGTQAGLLRAIHLLAQHGGGAVVASSGGVSGSAMLACCMHNLVPLLPILGATGLATFFSAYQTQVFLLSIGMTMAGVVYMIYKYYSIKSACETHHS